MKVLKKKLKNKKNTDNCYLKLILKFLKRNIFFLIFFFIMFKFGIVKYLEFIYNFCVFSITLFLSFI